MVTGTYKINKFSTKRRTNSGGRVVTWFLNRDLIDEMIIAMIPCILGKGIRLFPDHPMESQWNLVKSESFSTGVVNLSFRRIK